MAVPSKGAKVIFEAILKTFAGIPYEYIEPYVGKDEQEMIKCLIIGGLQDLKEN